MDRNNLIDFSEDKVEETSYGTINNILIASYKGTRRKEIANGANMKDVGVIINEKQVYRAQ